MNGISVYEKLRDSTNLAISYTNLAAIFDNVDNFKDEELYLKKALEFSKQNSVNYGITLCDLASNNLKKGVYNEAFNYLVEADSIKKFYNDNWLNFQVSRLYGEYYYFLKNYQKSVKYYETSLTDVEKLNNVFYKPEILGYLGNIYSKLGNKKIGLSYLKEAEKLNIQLKSRRNQKFIYQYLSEYYQKSNPKLALDYLSKSNKIKDSLNYFDNLKRVTYSENEFEITKKDNEIVQQQLEIAEQQNQLLESERKIFWGLSLFVLLGVVLVVLYFVIKQKQKLKDNEIIILKQKAKQTELEKLIEAEEKERTRIAQDLHDGVNGDLSAIKYHLSNINQDDLAKDLIKDLDKSIGMIDASCDQIRSISHNLSPYAIENYGLIDAVEQFCTKLNETNTTKIEFQNHGKVIHLPKFIETTLYRIIQELLSNTMKHSKAKEALVQINYQDDFMLITVEDDGVGFDVNKNKEGIGLKNIKSRVDLLEAKLSVDSNKTGSNFEIEIDLSNYI